MKIGILTFHYCNNYGAVLQAYALRECLSQMGHEVFFADYKLPILLHRYDYIPNYVKKKSFLKQVKYVIREIGSFYKLRKKKTKFLQFRNEFMPEVSIHDKSIDAWIVGSDQVWNPKITGGYNPIYYGNIGANKSVLFYAVSCPAELIQESPISRIKERNYPVGVRETTMINPLLSLGIKAEQVLDPVFLLKNEQWDNLQTQKKYSDPYILSYNLSGSKDLPEVAKILAQRYNWVNTLDMDILSESGPAEFVNLFRNANVALVCSFHGTALSIIFHIPFLFFPVHTQRDERALSLLEALGLMNCVFKGGTTTVQIPTVDWDDVDKKLDQLVTLSVKFLQKCEIYGN